MECIIRSLVFPFLKEYVCSFWKNIFLPCVYSKRTYFPLICVDFKIIATSLLSFTLQHKSHFTVSSFSQFAFYSCVFRPPTFPHFRGSLLSLSAFYSRLSPPCHNYSRSSLPYTFSSRSSLPVHILARRPMRRHVRRPPRPSSRRPFHRVDVTGAGPGSSRTVMVAKLACAAAAVTRTLFPD